MSMIEDFGFEMSVESAGVGADGIPFVVMRVSVPAKKSPRNRTGKCVLMRRKLTKHEFDQFVTDMDTVCCAAVVCFRQFGALTT